MHTSVTDFLRIYFYISRPHGINNDCSQLPKGVPLYDASANNSVSNFTSPNPRFNPCPASGWTLWAASLLMMLWYRFWTWTVNINETIITQSTHSPLQRMWKCDRNLTEMLLSISHTMTLCLVVADVLFVNSFRKSIRPFSWHWRRTDVSDIVSTANVRTLKPKIDYFPTWNILLTKLSLTASMKVSSGKDIRCLTFSVLELHTMELKFSDRGKRAMTPFGRNRCQATWLSVP